MRIKVLCGINDFSASDKKEPIYIRVNVGNKRQFIKVGVRILRHQWDARSCRVKDHPQMVDINLKILRILNEIETNHLNEEVAAVGDRKDFYWWFQERLNYSEKKHGYYNHAKLQSVYNCVKEFAPELKVKGLTSKFLRDFEVWLLDKKGNHPNSISDKMMRLKIIVREIVNAGFMPYHQNPFLSYKIRFRKRERPRVSYDELKKLEAAVIEHKAVEMARDMYVFSFYCGGMRFGDLVRIRISNVKDGRLVYMMNKARNQRSVKMNEKAMRLFNKYAEGRDPEERLFEVDIYWPDEEAQIKAKNSIMRKHLFSACDLAEIPRVSFHTARHSVADLAIKKKVSVRDLKDILGHSKIETTEIYMKNFYREETDEAMEKLFED